MVAFEPEGAFSPRVVTFKHTARCDGRNDIVWADLDKPIEFSVGDRLPMVILASRHVGSSLLRIKELPLHVYVGSYGGTDGDEILDPLKLKIKSWGLLLDANDPRNTLTEIFKR